MTRSKTGSGYESHWAKVAIPETKGRPDPWPRVQFRPNGWRFFAKPAVPISAVLKCFCLSFAEIVRVASTTGRNTGFFAFGRAA
jgi:hypothetical protein